MSLFSGVVYKTQCSLILKILFILSIGPYSYY